MKKILFTSLLFFIIVNSFSQDFTVVAPYTSPLRTTCGQINNCTLRTTEDHQYQVTIPYAAVWTFSLCGSTYDTYLLLGNTLCSSNLGLNDDFCGLQSQIAVTIPAGTYHVTVEGFSGCGSYVLNISAPAPLGEDCSGAIAINCGDVVTGNTSTYAADVAPTCVTTDGTGGGVWYKIIGTGNNITASLCGSTYDTKIRVFSGICTSLVCETGNDDFCGLQSEVTWLSTIGVTYYILVHGFGSSSGAYTLTMSCVVPPPPPTCYVINPLPYSPEAFAGTPVVLSDDVHSGVVPIGFSFCYFGTIYTQCVISSNNYITFDVAKANTWSPWSTVATPTAAPAQVMNSILSPWQDINPGAGGNIYYQTLGVAPNRRFVVSFLNIPMFSCSTLLYTSQIVLRESSNCIETHIANKPICVSWNSGNAVHAIQNATGTIAEIFVGRNNTAWSAVSEGSLWTPNCGVCQTLQSPLCLGLILPIKLLSFEANLNNNKVDLKWVTESEMNNDFFTVERSKDGIHWNPIVTTKGAGNSNQTIEYFETDYQPMEGVSYYRLRQTDFDGLTQFFDVVPVKYIKNGNNTMNVFPSLANSGETIFIEFDSFIGKEILVVLRDFIGNEYYSKLIVNIEDGKLIGIPLDMKIPSGLYLITATSENQVYSQKILIK